jgi:hypothetical protein
MTNFITDPSGVQWLATSSMGYYWSGFGVGLVFFSFGFIMRWACRLPKKAADF